MVLRKYQSCLDRLAMRKRILCLTMNLNKIQLANKAVISYQNMEKAHYQLFEVLVYYLIRYPGDLATIRYAIVSNNVKNLPMDVIALMKQNGTLSKENQVSQAIRDVCESYLKYNGSFNKDFLQK